MITSQSVNTNIKDYNSTENAFLPKYVNIPLIQESDSNIKFLVKSGDIVKEGQIIAVTSNETNIHASVPGEVIAVEPCNCPNGKQQYSVKIKFGGKLSYLGKIKKEKSIDSISANSIIDILKDKGVINTFDVKSSENLGIELSKKEKKASLIVRLFDEDIFRITDSLSTKFYFDEIIKGTKIIAKAMNASSILFVVDKNNDISEKIENEKIPNSYVLKMSLDRFSTLFKRGIIVQFNKTLKKTANFSITRKDLFIDSSTMYEVYKAVICDIPSISHLVQFSGNCIKSSCLLNVKVGMSINEIVNQIGGFTKVPEQIIINGMLSGVFVNDLNVPITKYVKSVTFLSKQNYLDKQIHKCINCGCCREVCPAKISPDVLYNTSTKFLNIPMEHAVSAVTCIECGLCNTVCPSRLPLSQTISILKYNQRELLEKEDNEEKE